MQTTWATGSALIWRRARKFEKGFCESMGDKVTGKIVSNFT